MWWRRDNDRGYSLTELLVVMGLMGIVLAAAYAIFQVTSNGSKQSDREAYIATEIGAPLGIAERVLQQNARLNNGFVSELSRSVTPTDYLVSFQTDQDSDSHWEMHIIEATADGRLVMTRLEQVDLPTPQVFAWSDHNYNQAAGIPLLTYFDSYDATITSAADYPTARRIRVTIVTEYDGVQFSDFRDILFRNR